MSRVDVVIPCYNYGRFLRECVTSVLAQDGVGVRALIIDDCSTDDTPVVAAQLAASDARVEWRRHGVNRGHIATYNEGLLEWASSEYCLLLSSDDALVPGSLARATRVMDEDRGVVLAYGRAPKTAHPSAEQGAAARDDVTVEILAGDAFIEQVCCTVRNPVPTATAVVRTASQRRAGGYRPELPHSGDMEMWLRLALQGAVAFIDAEQAYYRIHGQNMSFDHADVRDLQSRELAFTSFFRGVSNHPELASLRPVTMRKLGETAFWAASKAFDGGDVERYATYLELALTWWPAIRRTPSWIKLKLKRALGSSLWSRLRPLLHAAPREEAKHAAA